MTSPTTSVASATPRTTCHSLEVASVLHRFIEGSVLPGTGVSSEKFWKGFDAIVQDLAPKNIALLAERDRLQLEMDAWHKANPGAIKDMKAYRAFLEKIGYLVKSRSPRRRPREPGRRHVLPGKR